MVRSHSCLLFLFACFLGLSGCALPGNEYEAPSTEDAQAAYVAADDPLFEAGQASDDWWLTAFDAPTMNSLIEDAKENNRDIAAALARLEAAQARTSAARNALLPQGAVTAGVTRTNQAGGGSSFGGSGVPGQQPGQSPGQGDPSQQPGQQPGQPPAQGGGGFGGSVDDPIEIYSVGGNLSWEADLFGRLRAASREAAAGEVAQAALLSDTRRLIAARTAEAYLSWLEAARRLQVAQRNLAAQEEALALTEQLYEYGQIAEFDLKRQRTQVRITQASVLQLESGKAEALSGVALITGNTVPELLADYPLLAAESPVPEVPQMRLALPLDSPAEMLRRRPDVRAAEAQLAVANAATAGAAAALFPQLSVTGSVSSVALEPGNVGEDFTWSFGPRLSWPVFSLPQLQARVEGSDAAARAALAEYEQAVLNALTETDAALVAYSRAVDRAAVLAEAQGSALDALGLARARYEAGEDSLLTFLDAQRTALQTEDQYVSARIGAYLARVGVHRALAN